MIYSSAFARFSVDSLAIKLPSVDVNVFIFLSRQSARHFVPKRSGKIGTSIYVVDVSIPLPRLDVRLDCFRKPASAFTNFILKRKRYKRRHMDALCINKRSSPDALGQ